MPQLSSIQTVDTEQHRFLKDEYLIIAMKLCVEQVDV